MSAQQVRELIDLIRYNIVAQPYQFAAYFAAHWDNFLEPRVNPPFIYQGRPPRPCFDAHLTGREAQQLATWRRSGAPRNLRTSQIYYLERQRLNLQALVEYWDAQFVPLVSGLTGSQSGGATLGPGFTRSREFLKYRHVMTRPGGNLPPGIVLAGNLPRQYRPLRQGVWRLHRAAIRA
jgi:hypothetical protein